MKNTDYDFDTLAVHAGYTPESAEHSMTVPIYQTNAYAFESVEHANELFSLKASGNIYSRIGNPTVAVLEERIAALEGGVGALAMASGHAAIFNIMLNLAGSGDEIVSSLLIYGGAVNMLSATLGNIGIKTTFVHPDDFDAWEKAVTPKTKAFFVEVIGNPNSNIADIEKIAEIAHKHGIPLVVDSTMSTPYLIRPFEHGADIIVHSATKFLCGNGTTMAGLIVDSGKFKFLDNPRFPQYNKPDPSYHGIVFAKDMGEAAFIVRLRTLILRDIGACLSPFNAFLNILGLETLPLRMQKHCDNARQVAQYLAGCPYVTKVNYPVLKDSPYHELYKKYMPKGAGSVFTFDVDGTRETVGKVLNNCGFIKIVANLGDSKTIVSHPATTTHSQLTDEQLAESGIAPSTVRISVGIESAGDIIKCLDEAFKSVLVAGSR